MKPEPSMPDKRLSRSELLGASGIKTQLLKNRALLFKSLWRYNCTPKVSKIHIGTYRESIQDEA